MERIRLEIREYLRQNMGICIIIVALFALGVLTGALLLRGLEESQKLVLDQYFNLLVQSYHGQDLPVGTTILAQSLTNNIRFLVPVWLCGLFFLGFPLTLILVGLRGFFVGFTVGFLVDRAALRGLVFALGAVLPHNLLLVPAVIILAVASFSRSWSRFRGHLEKRPVPLKKHLAPYTLVAVAAAMTLFVGSLVEAYISPVFIGFLIKLF